MEFLYTAGFIAYFILSDFSMEAESETITQEIVIALMASIIWPATIWRLINATYHHPS